MKCLTLICLYMHSLRPGMDLVRISFMKPLTIVDIPCVQPSRKTLEESMADVRSRPGLSPAHLLGISSLLPTAPAWRQHALSMYLW